MGRFKTKLRNLKDKWLNLKFGGNKSVQILLLLNLGMSCFFLYHAHIMHSNFSKIQEHYNKVMDPAFKPYVRSFEISAKKAGTDISDKIKLFSIKFNNNPNRKFFKNKRIKNREVGWCMLFDREIAIDKVYWDKSDESARQALFDHELGHCLLGRVHIRGKILEDGQLIPKSIMLKNLVSSETYQKHQIYYREELFRKSMFNQLEDELIHPQRTKADKDDVSAAHENGDCSSGQD